ncbi:MAG: hypothetical protein RL711_1593 [Bacteroidota bacterium]|jgi:repressor LexA
MSGIILGQGGRIKQFVDYKEITMNKLNTILGYSNGMIGKIVASNGNLSNDKLMLLFSTFPELNKDWFLTGEGEMINKPSQEKINQKETYVAREYIQGVPMYNLNFAAGFDQNFISNNSADICGYINLPEVRGADAIVRVKGDSMADHIKSGDFIAIRKISGSIIPYGEIFAIVTDELALIKYVDVGSTPDTIKLRSHNDNYNTFEIKKSEIKQLFLVLSLVSMREFAI